MDKPATVAALQRLGVEQIRLDVYPEIVVTRPGDVDRLRDCEAVSFGAGRILVGFEGETVADVYINPAYPERPDFELRFSGMTGRDDVLEALSAILGAPGNHTIRCTAQKSDGTFPAVMLSNLGAADWALIGRYDRWTGTYRARIGYRVIEVSFGDGHVVDIERDWLPAPK